MKKRKLLSYVFILFCPGGIPVILISKRRSIMSFLKIFLKKESAENECGIKNPNHFPLAPWHRIMLNKNNKGLPITLNDRLPSQEIPQESLCS
jgi:hypothetical protein